MLISSRKSVLVSYVLSSTEAAMNIFDDHDIVEKAMQLYVNIHHEHQRSSHIIDLPYKSHNQGKMITYFENSTVLSLIVIVGAVLCFVGIGSNVLVCIVMRRSKRLLKVLSNFFIFELSIAELTLRVFLQLKTALRYFSIGDNDIEVFCAIFGTVVDMCCGAIFCLLAGIALDRYVNIVYPIKGRTLGQQKIKGTMLVWGYAVLTAVSTTPFYTKVNSVARCSEPEIINSTANCSEFFFCDTGRSTASKTIILINFFLRFMVPLLLVIACYLNIVSSLALSKRNESKLFRTTAVRKSTWKALKMLLLVVVSYVICWFPQMLFKICSAFGYLENFDQQVVANFLIGILMAGRHYSFSGCRKHKIKTLVQGIMGLDTGSLVSPL
ncbi:hypothetical protein QZH41_001251 [Actinostola sp. cb2023]|nr:hypothetical protein QZH41_001251 [Actinostola sp. cb2023]